MSRRNKWYLLALLAFMLVMLTGCGTGGEKTTTEDLLDGNFWSKYFVYPISYSLDLFADLFWNQYGISILILTIIIRLLVLPLNIKQYRSSKAMQALQPDIKKIRDRYKDDPKKQQEETMKLFQKHGVNPLAGCFPILIQMPILFALFHAISWNSEIATHSFMWLELGEKDPYYILPLLAAITTFIQQKVMQANMPPGANQMQALMMIFPVLIFVMAMSFPSALPLYWVYSNLFTVVQTYFLYGRPDKEKK
ncbi:membrane protein insertase YidC [Marinicrinis sediminis]|uniref:Membrane protein insertase YidC n=1 Tax=Marinicrinis sediminis TaxID=1652465 RepID=A0ABW5RB23_9BACL